MPSRKCAEVDVDVDPGRQVPQGDSDEGPSGVASSVGLVCAGVFVVEATPDTEVDVEASTAQDDEDDDGYGYGGETITDTRPLRARAHRPRHDRIQNTEYRIHCHVKPLHKATR